MYEAITKAYHESNAHHNQENKEKVYNYSILDRNFQEIKKGSCREVNYRYNPCQDYNVVSFTDIDTGESFSRCQFYVRLQEIK